jgi:hypothetical protein
MMEAPVGRAFRARPFPGNFVVAEREGLCYAV